MLFLLILSVFLFQHITWFIEKNMKIIENLKNNADFINDPVYKISLIISGICLWILISAIILNFVLTRRNSVSKVKKSVVETFSMFSFFLCMVVIVLSHKGIFNVSGSLSNILSITGTFIIIMGTVLNIYGRLSLKDNWGNQIRIYRNHTLVTSGIYKYVRHPLYSSTIGMIYGFSLLNKNYLVFILNSVIFIPFMIYRAKQEEVLLYETFKENFLNYKNETGMLFPRIIKRGDKSDKNR